MSSREFLLRETEGGHTLAECRLVDKAFWLTTNGERQVA